MKEGKFVTTKCKSCGAVTFPPQADCPKCMGREVEWVDVGPEASLVTYTHVMITPASFVDSDPYIIGIGEFPVGVKVLAWLEGVPLEKASVGMRLRLEARSRDGNPYYVFVPA